MGILIFLFRSIVYIVRCDLPRSILYALITPVACSRSAFITRLMFSILYRICILMFLFLYYWLSKQPVLLSFLVLVILNLFTINYSLQNCIFQRLRNYCQITASSIIERCNFHNLNHLFASLGIIEVSMLLISYKINFVTFIRIFSMFPSSYHTIFLHTRYINNYLTRLI